jgi:hypothetical protein
MVVVDCTREERKGDSVMTAHPFFKCFLLALSLAHNFFSFPPFSLVSLFFSFLFIALSARSVAL